MSSRKHYQPNANKFKGTQMFIVVSQENSRANPCKCFLPSPAHRLHCMRLEPFTVNLLLIYFVLLTPASCPLLGIQISLSLLRFPCRPSGRMAVSAGREVGEAATLLSLSLAVLGNADCSTCWGDGESLPLPTAFSKSTPIPTFTLSSISCPPNAALPRLP